MVHSWEPLLTDTDRAIINMGSYGKAANLGNRPALLIVDAQLNMVGRDLPILEQINEYPSGVGHAAWAVMPKIRQLLAAARDEGVPLVYTVMRRPGKVRIAPSHQTGLYQHIRRSPEFMTDTDPGQKIIEELAPQEQLGDLVLAKEQASAFFGTPLLTYLVKWKIDTLLLAGGTTSGCIRATAVDAASVGMTVAVVEDCVFDRIQLSHHASLLDIWMKYGTVISLDEALDYLAGLGQNSLG